MNYWLYMATVHAQYQAMMGAFWLSFWIGVACFLVGVTVTGLIALWWIRRIELGYTDAPFEHRYPSRWTTEKKKGAE